MHDNVSAVRLNNGRLLWEYDTGAMVQSQPSAWGDLLVVGNDAVTLFALDKATGSSVWRYQTCGAITVGPAVYENFLFVGSVDRKLHAFEIETDGESDAGGANP